MACNNSRPPEKKAESAVTMMDTAKVQADAATAQADMEFYYCAGSAQGIFSVKTCPSLKMAFSIFGDQG